MSAATPDGPSAVPTPDLTEANAALRREVAELRRESLLLARTQAAARIGGWEFNAVTKALYWTEETYHIHETSAVDYTPVLESALAFYAPESLPALTAAIQKALAEGQPYDLELELITAKRRRIWVRTIGEAQMENGRVNRLFGSFQDITKQRRMSALLRVSQQRLQYAVKLSGA